MTPIEKQSRLDKIASYEAAIKTSKSKKDIHTYKKAIATHKEILGLPLSEEETKLWNSICNSFNKY